MKRTRWTTLLAALLVIGAALPAGAGSRFPVSSAANAGDSIANRIAAVTNTVVAVDQRLVRVENHYPPNPCSDPGIALAIDGVWSARDGFFGTIVDDDAAADLFEDADVHADDVSASGVANQLWSVATVLDNAGSRYAGAIAGVVDITPATAVALGDLVIAVDSLAPPNPCDIIVDPDG